jgi:hypothetical protein
MVFSSYFLALGGEGARKPHWLALFLACTNPDAQLANSFYSPFIYYENLPLVDALIISC